MSPTPTPQLTTTTINYSGALSVEDLNTLILAIRAENGIVDVQGGVNELMVVYDPKLITRQKIIEVIIGHNYTVKE